MYVKFGHKKNPDKYVLFNVPEPLPPTWLIALPNKELPTFGQPLTADTPSSPRVAIFQRDELIHRQVGSPMFTEPFYTFKEWR